MRCGRFWARNHCAMRCSPCARAMCGAHGLRGRRVAPCATTFQKLPNEEGSQAMVNRWQQVYEKIQALFDCDFAVLNATVYPRWIPGSRTFWYDRQRPHGDVELCLVDAPSADSRVLFTLSEVAALLGRELGVQIETRMLMLEAVDIRPDRGKVTFGAFEKFWQMDLGSRTLSRIERRTDWRWTVSPDGRTALFLKDSNIWARDLTTGAERPLTNDGHPDNAYADVPSAYRPYKLSLRRGPEGCWSPDSRFFLTVQTDERHVPALPIVDYAPTGGDRPTVDPNRTSLPGDLR